MNEMETYDNKLLTFLSSNIKIAKKGFDTSCLLYKLTKKVYIRKWTILSIKDQSIFLVNVVTIYQSLRPKLIVCSLGTSIKQFTKSWNNLNLYLIRCVCVLIDTSIKWPLPWNGTILLRVCFVFISLKKCIKVCYCLAQVHKT